MYYLTTEQYVGPDRTDSDEGLRHGELEALISVNPGTKNQSGAVCVDGWLGTTNDISRQAWGAFGTQAQAEGAAAEMGYTRAARTTEDEHNDDRRDGVVCRLTTPAGAAEQWDAADWLGGGDVLVTAATTDEELETLADNLDQEAMAENVRVHYTRDYLRSVRASWTPEPPDTPEERAEAAKMANILFRNSMMQALLYATELRACWAPPFKIVTVAPAPAQREAILGVGGTEWKSYVVWPLSRTPEPGETIVAILTCQMLDHMAGMTDAELGAYARELLRRPTVIQ